MMTARIIAFPAQAKTTEPVTGTTWTIVTGTTVRYAGSDPDAAIRALTDLYEAEEDGVIVHAATNGAYDAEAVKAVVDEATVSASRWPQCGLPVYLTPWDMREHVATCRVCGRDD